MSAAAYKRGATFSIRVPRRDKPAKVVGTGSGDPATVKAMHRMVRALADRREWDLLAAVTDGPVSKRLGLGDLFDAYRSNALDELRARVREPDLRDYVEGWEEWLATRVRSARMLERYPRVLRTLVSDDEPFPVSRFTDPEVLTGWIVGPALAPGKVTTGVSMRWQRKTVASSFAKYLIALRVIRHNPLRDVAAVAKPTRRVRWLPQADIDRLVEAQPEPFRTIAAVREGAGGEVSAVLAMRVGDVDTSTWMVRLRGTKTASRDRLARLAPWARGYVLTHLERTAALPEAALFPGVEYHQVYAAHRAACEALKITDYTLHDARHSFAVNARKAGVRDELIAANLGHKDTSQVHAVYGQYTPSVEDWERAEARTVQDQARKRRKGGK